MGALMNAAEVRAALVGRWPDDRYLHVYEASTNPSRQGRQIDVLVMALWSSLKYELDAVEVKVSYSDWKKEIERTEWVVIDHEGREHPQGWRPNDWNLNVYRHGRYRQDVPENFQPTVERRVIVDTFKSAEWRARTHRFWIACPVDLALKVDADCARLELGWGVLACGGGGTRVVRTPVKNSDVAPLSHMAWLGILRPAADSGFQALVRAEHRGYDRGYKDAQQQAAS